MGSPAVRPVGRAGRVPVPGLLPPHLYVACPACSPMPHRRLTDLRSLHLGGTHVAWHHSVSLPTSLTALHLRDAGSCRLPVAQVRRGAAGWWVCRPTQLTGFPGCEKCKGCAGQKSFLCTLAAIPPT